MKTKRLIDKFEHVTDYRGYPIYFDNDSCDYLVIRKSGRDERTLTLSDAYEAIDMICDWR